MARARDLGVLVQWLFESSTRIREHPGERFQKYAVSLNGFTGFVCEWVRVLAWQNTVIFLSRLHKFANPLGPIKKTPWRIVKKMRFRWTDSLVLWRGARGVGWQNTVICLKLSTQALISFFSVTRVGEVFSYGGGCRLRYSSDVVCSKLPTCYACFVHVCKPLAMTDI